MKIGNVEIKGYMALAPMAGVADTAFRTVCKEFGAAYVVGEMASAKGLCMSGEKSRELLTVTPPERPMAVQLFGDEPEIMARAAQLAMAFSPDILDINMGCPAPKVTSNGSGSMLMRDPKLAGEIINQVVRAVEIPVTVKLRTGWDQHTKNVVEIAKLAEENGAAAVAVHGRTREQMYTPPADLDSIAQVMRALTIPVIGNGDVTTPQQAKHMLEYTGCDLVMIGRGALGSPWLFRQANALLEKGENLPGPDITERADVMLRHIKLLCARKGEYGAMLEARKHAAWYMKGLNGASQLRTEAFRLARYEDIENLAKKMIELNL